MTLAARLLLLIALALLPPLVFGIVNDVARHNERTAELQQSALSETRALQNNVKLLTDGIQRMVVTLSQAPAIKTGNPVACTNFLRNVARLLPEYSLLGVTDLDGEIVCTDGGVAPRGYSVRERAYFQRALATDRFVAGDLVTGVFTLKKSLHFAIPFRGMDGAAAGVVLASVEQDWLGRQLARETMPAGAEVVLVDPGGTVVAAVRDGVPVQADWIGQPAPESMRDLLRVTTPQVVELLGPDGVVRLFGAVPPQPGLSGLGVVVGLDRERAFTDLRGATMRNIAGLITGGVIALIAGTLGARRFVLNPLGRLAAAADRVGAGDLTARADLGERSGELGELGAVFNRMAAALAARQQERDDAEAALRRNEARLRFALEVSGQGSFEWDTVRDAIQRSETVAAMFGFGPAEGWTSGDYFARMVPEDRETARTVIAAGVASGRVVVSYRIVPREGERRFVTSRGEMIVDAAGHKVFVGLIVDETERFENISALSESEARFQAIADCIDQMVWSTRPDGYHDYFNQRWYDFTGRTPGTTERRERIALTHPDDHAACELLWQRSLATGAPYHQEYRLRHASGRFHWVLERAQAIRDEQGRIVRWYGTCTDIDEIVQAREVLARSREVLTREVADRTAELMVAEEQLRQSQKMEAVGQLTGGIAHDFNNMLQAIGGALELLVRRVEQNKLDDAKRFAGIARETVDRAASLTHRLLAFARRQTLSPEPVDVAGLLDGMSDLVGRTVGPAIDLSTQHGAETWPVLCDLSQLENVVFNLCINARDAMPGGGKLTLGARNVVLAAGDLGQAEAAQAGEYVEIAVADSGEGMDEATKARAFEPFFTTKPLGQGTGLGLSQVYGFVRQSGGFVQLESAPGRGTSVRLYLPRHERADAPAADEAERGAMVLLVLEDAGLRTAAAAHLRALGYRVRDSGSGAEAIVLLGGGMGRVDLMVTDVGLSYNVNGRQVAEAARQRHPDLPVLLVTSYAGDLSSRALGPGLSIIARPVTPEALALRVQSLVAVAATAAASA